MQPLKRYYRRILKAMVIIMVYCQMKINWLGKGIVVFLEKTYFGKTHGKKNPEETQITKDVCSKWCDYMILIVLFIFLFFLFLWIRKLNNMCYILKDLGILLTARAWVTPRYKESLRYFSGRTAVPLHPFAKAHHTRFLLTSELWSGSIVSLMQ